MPALSATGECSRYVQDVVQSEHFRVVTPNRPRHSYAEEEVTVELASSLIVQRLGLGDAHLGQSARYIQQWLTRCPDDVASRAFAEHEAKHVANYICAIWDQLNTTN